MSKTSVSSEVRVCDKMEYIHHGPWLLPSKDRRSYREAVADGGVAIYFCYPQLEWGRSQEQQQVPQVLHKMCVVCRSRQRLGMALGTSWLAMRGGSCALR